MLNEADIMKRYIELAEAVIIRAKDDYVNLCESGFVEGGNIKAWPKKGRASEDYDKPYQVRHLINFFGHDCQVYLDLLGYNMTAEQIKEELGIRT